MKTGWQMKTVFLKRMFVVQGVALSLVLSHIACSKSYFQEAYTSPNGDVVATPSDYSGGRQPASIEPSPMDDLNKPVVEGYATGVRSEVSAFQWENWGLYGTTIQLQYSISDYDAYQTSFQIFPKDGGDEIVNPATDSALLAMGNDGRPFVFSQYANLEKSRGLHTFNLPLKYSYSNGNKQYLKLGDYKLFITACKTKNSTSCHKSKPIAFSVKN
jgi:hypothetical protein